MDGHLALQFAPCVSISKRQYIAIANCNFQHTVYDRRIDRGIG